MTRFEMSEKMCQLMSDIGKKNNVTFPCFCGSNLERVDPDIRARVMNESCTQGEEAMFNDIVNDIRDLFL